MTDTPQLLTRRRSLGLLGTGSAGLVLAGIAHPGRAVAKTESDDYVADAAAACTLTAEQEEGPFYVAVDDVRSDIVLGQVGLPFDLTITIINKLTCKPIKHAAVDIWHCNASGVYSDITSEDSYGKTFLRGVQFTDKHGQVSFTTIFPGHYSGRTTHIHARIHIDSGDYKNKLVGGHVAHTGQMFPSDAVNAEVYALSPYKAETATVVTHAKDAVYTGQHGSEVVMKVTQNGNRLTRGLSGSVVFAVDPSATPALIGATSSASTVDGQGGGSSSGAPGGTAPTGTPPTGTPPTGTPPTGATSTGTTTTGTTTTATPTTS
jgi:protocatechuate 3,4-dioxygenase beta subunit